MPVNPRLRRELVARSHALNPAVVITPAGPLAEGLVTQVRAAFARRELVKVRVNADVSAAADAVGMQLADRVPCEFVRRIGKVLILYRPVVGEKPDDAAGGESADGVRDA